MIPRQFRNRSNASDLRVVLVALLQTATNIFCCIIFLIWTYRINKNAHCLSFYTLSIKPGWSVGWYFVPIANLIYPYTALDEAYNASCHPENKQKASGAGFILAWWWIHILTGILGQFYFRMSLRAGDEPTLDFLILQNGVGIGSDAMGVLLNLMTLVIVARFLSRQRESHERILSHIRSAASGMSVPPYYQQPQHEPPSEYQTFGS